MLDSRDNRYTMESFTYEYKFLCILLTSFSLQLSSLRRKDLESDLEPMSTALDALIVMQERQDKQIEDNLAEMKRHELLTKGLLEGVISRAAGIIPPFLPVRCQLPPAT